ncbi:inosine/xanthosine triphosphatase [Shewanella cyperi]
MTMKTSISLLVGSTNPVKIAAARDAFAAVFKDTEILCRGISSPSGVADQPMTREDTRLGAINRARFCESQGGADYFIAMEGGVDCFEDGPATFAYVAIVHQDRLSVGRSAQLPLPPRVYHALQQGQELGHVMDALFNTVNVKHAGGAIGLLTANAATRGSSYTQALILALAPMLHPELYELSTC